MRVFSALNKYVTVTRSRFMVFITFLGNHLFLIPANLLLIIYFLFVRRQTWFSVRIAAIALSSLVLMLLLKQLFRRKRPLEPLLNAAKGLSFPSGHAIMSVTFYGLLIYIISQTVENNLVLVLLITVLVALIILIGFSRVYLRVHYASDVIAGFIIGIVWLVIALGIVKKTEALVADNTTAAVITERVSP
jgi:membrane-associated phospholipid phosphatase